MGKFKDYLNEGRNNTLEVVVSKAGEVSEFLSSDFRGAYKAEATNYFSFKKEEDLENAVMYMIDMKIISSEDIIETSIDLDELTEKTKINGGNGYWESFSSNNKAMTSLSTFEREVARFISDSEDFADEEGLSSKEQKELIIDDIIANIYKSLGGK